MRLLQLIEKTKKGKFGRAQTYRLYMPNGGEDGVLIGWRADWPESHYVEFRGPPYSQWKGEGSDFERVHDALEGRHATVLHTNDILDVLPMHPRYDLIKNAIEKEEMPPVTRGYAFESKLLGPHQGKELNLMLAGKKPFALIDTNLLSNKAQAGWWHAVATGKIIHAIGINVKHKMDYFSLPGEEWRMEKTREIFQDVRDTDTMTDEHHTTLGQLLGYSDEAIRHFVGDRPSLSEADPEELKLPDLKVGDELMVGKFKNRNATIKGFKADKHNQPIAKTDKGDQQIFKGRVKKLMNQAVTEEVIPFTKQWAPSDIALQKIWQVVQALIKKGMGDELNGRFDNFLFAIEQYNDMAAQRGHPSELADLSEKHLHQIYEYGKKLHWQPLSRSGFKARQRMIAKSWGKEVTEGIDEPELLTEEAKCAIYSALNKYRPDLADAMKSVPGNSMNDSIIFLQDNGLWDDTAHEFATTIKQARRQLNTQYPQREKSKEVARHEQYRKQWEQALKDLMCYMVKLIKGSRVTEATEKFDKAVVWDNGRFFIAVNNPDKPTFFTAWTQDNEKIGTLATKVLYKQGEPWIGVDYVDVTQRKQGVARAMYHVLLQGMSPEFGGLMGYGPDIASKAIPKIYKRMGAHEQDGHYYVPNPNRPQGERSEIT